MIELVKHNISKENSKMQHKDHNINDKEEYRGVKFIQKNYFRIPTSKNGMDIYGNLSKRKIRTVYLRSDYLITQNSLLSE